MTVRLLIKIERIGSGRRSRNKKRRRSVLRMKIGRFGALILDYMAHSADDKINLIFTHTRNEAIRK